MAAHSLHGKGPLRDALLAALLGAGFYLACMLLRSQQYTYDSLMFANAIRVDEFSPTVFRPHNLAYLPAAMLLHRARGQFTAAPDPFLSGQLLAGAFGGIAVALFFLLCRRFTDRTAAILATLLFATTHAVSSMSSTVEVYTVSLSFVLLTCLMLARRNPSFWGAGTAWGAAVLGHLTNVLLVVPAVVLFCTGHRQHRWRGLLVLCAAGGALALFVYAITGWSTQGARTPLGLLRWMGSYATGTEEFGAFSLRRPAEGLLGFKRALVTGPAKALMLIHMALFGLAALRLLSNGPVRRRVLPTLAAFLGTYAAFFTWWEPLNVEFWLVTMVPAWLAVAIALRRNKIAPPSSWHDSRQWLLGLAAAALIVQLTFNGLHAWRASDPAGDFWMSRGRDIAAAMAPADFLVTFNDPLTFTLPLAVGNPRILAVDLEAGAMEADLAMSMRVLVRIAEAVKSEGGRLLFTEDALRPPTVKLQRLDVTQDEYSAALEAAIGALPDREVAPGLFAISGG